jgi:hypothetical protein
MFSTPLAPSPPGPPLLLGSLQLLYTALNRHLPAGLNSRQPLTNPGGPREKTMKFTVKHHDSMRCTNTQTE